MGIEEDHPMKTTPKPFADIQLAARQYLPDSGLAGLWRVKAGALRIDSARSGESRCFMRLALPGDVIGVEHWVGAPDVLAYGALTEVALTPVQAAAPDLTPLLMDTVVVAHQRCREVVTLRTGPVAQRVKALLLMFAEHVNPQAQTQADCALPQLADLAVILDAAPETVSRVFSSMRRLDWLQERRPQQARFDSLVLRAQTLIPGMSAGGALQRSQLAGA